MKKGSESPLQQQAHKRFLGQITGLDVSDQDNSASESGLQRFFGKLKELF